MTLSGCLNERTVDVQSNGGFEWLCRMFGCQMLGCRMCWCAKGWGVKYARGVECAGGVECVGVVGARTGRARPGSSSPPWPLRPSFSSRPPQPLRQPLPPPRPPRWWPLVRLVASGAAPAWARGATVRRCRRRRWRSPLHGWSQRRVRRARRLR